MRTYDFSPLFRSTVGFDHVQRMLDAALRVDDSSLSYPPYNIEARGDDQYRITMAVAGFGPEDLEITEHQGTLIISGRTRKDEGKAVYLHRGIAGRSFERRFRLADFIKVGGAELANGLLHVDLVREVPDEMKPRKVEITRAAPESGKAIEKRAA
jgi:molecular chaperone IbpA